MTRQPEPEEDPPEIVELHEAAKVALETAVRVRRVLDTRPLIRNAEEVLAIFERRRRRRDLPSLPSPPTTEIKP